MVARVVVDCKSDQVNRIFDYHVPSYFEDAIKVGSRVYVPFGHQNLLGVVIGLEESSDYPGIKDIYELLDLEPCLNQEMLDLASGMQQYYFSLYINCLLTMIPTALRLKYEKKFIVKESDELPKDLESLFKEGEFIYTNTHKDKLPRLMKLVKDGVIDLENVFEERNNVKKVSMIRLTNKGLDGNLKPQQKEIINHMYTVTEEIKRKDLCDLFSVGRVNTLIKNGILEVYEKEIYRHFDEGKEYVDKKVTFNSEQQEVYERIKKAYQTKETFLLHGITGSGKTEIYLQVIEDVVKDNKTAILLVPEISLTPQIVARFKARFGEDVAVLHSRLSDGERYDEWRKIYKGEVHIVVGARSAIFAPLSNLGVIIIDEEHETSYKQLDQDPRYDAKMIARIRARNHNCPLILGSATPSIESYYLASQGKFTLLELQTRANHKGLPEMKLVDMTQELKSGNKSLFSKELMSLLTDRLKKKEQAILLLNRRGFSSFVMCRDCGEVVKCPHCEVSLTYHKNDNTLKCHYCGYKKVNVTKCPSCGSFKVRFVGGGTQKVVEELESIFPEARIARMDFDNTKNKGDHERIIESFANYEADILVGTQMVAKGLNFPKCSLVGILNADLSLKYPSYESPALAYNLFTQVAGRAGRDETDGTVILQAYDINHYAIINAKIGEYQKFYEEELLYRKLGKYPPFYKIIEIKVTGKDYQTTYQEASAIVSDLKKDNLMVLGPAEDYIVKLQDKYHFIVTLKYQSENEIKVPLEKVSEEYKKHKNISVIISRM